MAKETHRPPGGVKWSKRATGEVHTSEEKSRASIVVSAILAVSQPYSTSEIHFANPDEGRALLDQTIGVGRTMNVIDAGLTIARNAGPRTISELFELDKFTVEMKNGSSILFVRKKPVIC